MIVQDYALQDSLLQVQEEISRALSDFERARDQAQLFKTASSPKLPRRWRPCSQGIRWTKWTF